MSSTLKSNKIFIALVEVIPLKGCEIDPSEIKGAAVRLYIPAVSFFDAVEKIQATLKEDCFDLVEIEMLVEENCVDWENPDDETGTELSTQALESNELIYSEFYAWDE